MGSGFGDVDNYLTGNRNSSHFWCADETGGGRVSKNIRFTKSCIKKKWCEEQNIYGSTEVC